MTDMYVLSDSFDKVVERWKVRYQPHDIDVINKLTAEDKDVKELTERLRKAVRFICDNPVYRLRIYQKHLAREGIIIMMPLILGTLSWEQHRVRILDEFNIEKHFETLFSVTGRRFGTRAFLT